MVVGSFGSSNELLDYLLSIGEWNSLKLQSKYNTFHASKYILKCRLQSRGMRYKNDSIDLKFGSILSRTVAEAPVKFQSDRTTFNP